MNKFVSSLLGAFTGTWIAFFVIGIFIFFSGIVMISSLASSTISPIATIGDNAILRIDLSGSITDKPYNKSLQELVNNDGNASNLYEILGAIDHASTDSNIKGIYINCDGAGMGVASATAIRNALISFKKKSGKWIYAYGNDIAQGDYYAASVADKIFLNPAGALDIHGLTSSILFYKGLLDKIGVEMQIIRVGTYKSAVEPFMLTQMSEANKQQTSAFIGSIWKNITSDIASSRKVNADDVQAYSDSIGAFQDAEIAVSKKFVDELCYEHQVESKLRKLVGITETDDLNFVSPSDVMNSVITDNSSGEHIAIVYAEGEINVDGNSSSINSKDIVPEIIKLANDKSVKGLVLRVNSPGGSAFASEQIWEALDFFKSKNKPFAVSMGDYAASGGYYISAGADRIFAEKTTITGSIGIYGMIPNVKRLANDKLGITADFVSTSPNSNLSAFEPLTPTQRNAIQCNVNRGYELFVARCAKGRHKTTDEIKAIAEGRVWDGESAKEIGLVDQFGGIEDAAKWVANKAKLGRDFKLKIYPEFKPDFINLLYATIEKSATIRMQQSYNPELLRYALTVQDILNKDRIQCRMEDICLY